jgi:hypothetical protein
MVYRKWIKNTFQKACVSYFACFTGNRPKEAAATLT